MKSFLIASRGSSSMGTQRPANLRRLPGASIHRFVGGAKFSGCNPLVASDVFVFAMPAWSQYLYAEMFSQWFTVDGWKFIQGVCLAVESLSRDTKQKAR